ncbi:MAG TPA: hypothetical protein PKL14_11840 [Holophaga sp.]|jgi:hypothetical protein|nr:hypothetical protein [Holophaga sp.]
MSDPKTQDPHPFHWQAPTEPRAPEQHPQFRWNPYNEDPYHPDPYAPR